MNNTIKKEHKGFFFHSWNQSCADFHGYCKSYLSISTKLFSNKFINSYYHNDTTIFNVIKLLLVEVVERSWQEV